MPRFLVVSISSLVSATSICTEVFVKIYWHWVTKLHFVGSGGKIQGYIGILSVFFSTISGKDLHQILVLSENLLQDFCSSCCNFWCWISRGVTVYHIFLMLKFGREAYYNVSHEVGLSVTSSF